LKEVSSDEAESLWQGCESDGQLLPIEEINGAKVNRICLPRHKTWRRWFIFNQQVVAYCSRADYRPDVVQFVTNLRPRAIPWLLRLRRMRVPTIYAVTLAPDFSKYSALKVWKFKLLFNLLSGIVTNSAAIRDMLHTIGVSTAVEVISNGVNMQRFRPVQDGEEKIAIRRRLGLADDAFIIIAVGAVSPRKGSDLLLAAWSELVSQYGNLHVLMVGPRKDQEHPGLNRFSADIDAAIQSSGKPDQVHFPGLQDQVEEYLRASDLLVLASDREGMPNSMLEAMASGLPVIITPFIGLTADLGESGRHYRMAERSVAGLKQQLKSLLDDAGERERLAREGHDWISEHMDVERSLDRYAAMYRRVAGKTAAD
jgi:glycosyltransferase involved in cell wall biosynthesis